MTYINIKNILCLHSNLPWVYFNLMPGNLLRNFITKKLMEMSIYSCDLLIVNSNFAKKEIVKALRDLGCSVVHLHECGHGIPDLLVGKDGITYLVEIKRDVNAKFTVHQIAFMEAWKGAQVVRINNVDEAIAFVKNMV